MASPLEAARALLDAGQFAAAERLCDAALAGGESPDLLFLLASARHRQSRRAAALAALERALELAPSRDDIRLALGSTLAELGRDAEAEPAIEACLAAAPRSPDLAVMLAGIRERLGRHDAARALYERALEADPEHFAARLDLGVLHLARGRAAEALAEFDALALRHARPEVHVNRAQALLVMFRDEEALAAADAALALDAANLLAALNRAQALAVCGRTAEAEEAFRTARALDAGAFDRLVGDPAYGHWRESPPDPATIAMLRAVQVQQHCDWSRRAEAAARVRALPCHVLGGLLARRHALVAFDLLALPLGPREQHAIGRHFARAYPPAAPRAPALRREGRVRVGFLSPDFRLHPMAWLGRRVLGDLDRARFEVTAYALNPDDGDPLRATLLAAADRAVDLSASDDDAATARIAGDGIDVLVECGGYCEGARPSILARRPAPVQASWLGMPATLGLDCIDYRISDAHCTPPEAQAFWTEKLVLLPDTHLAYDPPAGPLPAVSRAGLGLPGDAFVYACLSNPMKIDPEIFSAWTRILGETPGSVLWLFASNERAQGHLQRAAAAAGLPAERLVFTPRLPHDAFIAAAGQADLFLDTLHFGAHTTAMDVLWGGLPILTCPGETMASRLAASLVHAARIPELVVPDLEAYVATAVRLARDRATLDTLRARVRAARGPAPAPIFDTAARVKAFEDAVLAMHRRRLAGLPPATLVYRPEYGAFFSAADT